VQQNIPRHATSRIASVLVCVSKRRLGELVRVKEITYPVSASTMNDYDRELAEFTRDVKSFIKDKDYQNLHSYLRGTAKFDIYSSPDAFFLLLEKWMHSAAFDIDRLLLKRPCEVYRMFSYKTRGQRTDATFISIAHQIVAAKAEKHLYCSAAFHLPLVILTDEQRELVKKVTEASERFGRSGELKLPRRLHLPEVVRQVADGVPFGVGVCFVEAYGDSWNKLLLTENNFQSSDEGKALALIHRLRYERSVLIQGKAFEKLAIEFLAEAFGSFCLALRNCSFCHPRSVVGADFSKQGELFFKKTGFKFDQENKAHFM